MKCYMEYGKVENAADTLRTIIELLEGRPVGSRNVKLDFLKGKITEADINIVYEIVNYRYNNHLPLIISTEKTLDDLISFDEAVGSRLIEMCRGHIIVFEGRKLNYRLYRGGVA